MKKRGRLHRSDYLALLLLALLVLALHHSALTGSWRWDDGMHLLHTTQYPWTSVFLDPDVLRSVSGNQFAPWNLFIYYVNRALFGANVGLYYAHHLISVWAAATGLYVLLRQWLPALRAWVPPALLLAGIPTFQMAQQLMVGHYIDGLLFASIGLALQVRAVRAWDTARGNAWCLSIAGALLYALACLCKEIYVPWILMWLVVPWVLDPSPRKVVMCASPAMLVALAYTLARIQLFGGSGAYYGGGVADWNMLHLAQSLAGIPDALFGNGVRSAASMGLVFLALLVGSRYTRAWRLILVCGSALIVTLVPLVFLAGSNPSWDLHARYLWAPWLLLCLAWALPWHGALRRMQLVACLLFAILAAWQVTALRPEDQKLEALFDAHSRMAIQPPAGTTHWVPAEFNSPAYMTFISYAAQEALRRDGHAAKEAPKLLRAPPSSPAEQKTVQVWNTLCNCFRSLATLTQEEQQTALARLMSNKGMLLPGIHPLADAYQGPTPEMRVEGRHLHVSGTTASEGNGHVLILAGWAPSNLVASTLTTKTSTSGSVPSAMNFNILLEAKDAATAQYTREHLCVLMQSQLHPYTYIALDSAAPSTACRNLLTPWALQQPTTGRH